MCAGSVEGVGLPLDAGDAVIAGGPHPLELGGEAEGEVGGVEAVELIEDKRTGAPPHRRELVHGKIRTRRKHDLADSEAEVGVGDDGAVGADLDGGGVLVEVDGNGVASDAGLDGEVGEELDGENPRLERAVLTAEEDAVRAGDGEGLLGLDGGAENGAGDIKRDGGDGRQGGRRSLRGSEDCGGCAAEQGEKERAHTVVSYRCYLPVGQIREPNAGVPVRCAGKICSKGKGRPRGRPFEVVLCAPIRTRA